MKKEITEIIQFNPQEIGLRKDLQACFPDLDLEKARGEWKEEKQRERNIYIGKIIKSISNQFFEALIKYEGKQTYKGVISKIVGLNEDFHPKTKQNFNLDENKELDEWLEQEGYLEALEKLRQKYPKFKIDISLVRVETDEVGFTCVQVVFEIVLGKANKTLKSKIVLSGQMTN